MIGNTITPWVPAFEIQLRSEVWGQERSLLGLGRACRLLNGMSDGASAFVVADSVQQPHRVDSS